MAGTQSQARPSGYLDLMFSAWLPLSVFVTGTSAVGFLSSSALWIPCFIVH